MNRGVLGSLRASTILAFLAIVLALAATATGTSVARALPVDALGDYSPADAPTSYPPSGWRSTLYPSNWTPGMRDAQGRALHDFSYAGYRYGEVPLPAMDGSLTVDVTDYPFEADSHGKRDATKAIQRAIDHVGRSGGGVVYLPAGTYRVRPLSGRREALRVNRNGVVLRGAGRERTFLVNTSTTMGNKAVVSLRPDTVSWWFDGPLGFPNLAGSSSAGSRHVRVTNPGLFEVGDLVVIRTEATPDWVRSMGSPFGWGAESMDASTQLRKVVSVSQDGVLGIDIPLRSSVLLRDRGTAPNVFVAGGHLSEVGVEDLSIGMVQHPGGPTFAEDVHESSGIRVTNVVDGWIARVGTFAAPGNRPDVHLLSEGIWLGSVRSITVRDCLIRFPQYRGGGDGYGFIIRGSDNLIERCSVERGRHSYSFSYWHTTGNVVRDSTGANASLASDFHAWLAAANLVDGMRLDGDWIDATYRYDGTRLEHGPSTSQSVIWNTAGHAAPKVPGYGFPGALVHSVQWGWGAVVGTSGRYPAVITDPGSDGWRADGFVDLAEGVGGGTTLVPESLSRDQLERRTKGAAYVGPRVSGAVLPPMQDVRVVGGRTGTPGVVAPVRGRQSWQLAFTVPGGAPVTKARLVLYGRSRSTGGALSVHRSASPTSTPEAMPVATNVRGASPPLAAWVFDVRALLGSTASRGASRTVSVRVTEALPDCGVDFVTSRSSATALRPRLEIERAVATRLSVTVSPSAAARATDGHGSTSYETGLSGVPVVLDLGSSRLVESVGVAFANGSDGFNYAEVQASTDGREFRPVRGIVSGGGTSAMETFELDVPVQARFLRFVGFGSSNLARPFSTSFSEIEVYGS